MGELILVTGGARSGKSAFAESLLKDIQGDVLYIATAIPFDEEMKIRIKKHQQQRPETWHTYEGYKDLGKVVDMRKEKYKGVLLDCVTILVTNLMFEFSPHEDTSCNDYEVIEDKIKDEIKELIKSIKEIDAKVVLVTNELGCGIVPENKLSRVFRDIAGRVNQYIASEANEVQLCVCGIPMKIK